MMIIMHTYATQEQIDAVVGVVRSHGLRAHLSTGEERTIIGVVGDDREVMALSAPVLAISLVSETRMT